PRSCPLPLNPAHAPPPPLRSLSHCPAATVASRSPAPPPLPHPRSGSRLPFSSLPLSVAPDRLAGGVWERGTCEQVSSLDAEKTVPSTDSLMSDCWCFVLCKECGRSSPPLQQHNGGAKEEADHQVDVSDGIRLVPDKAEATAAAPGRCWWSRPLSDPADD
ncbi:hypothetical protein U0070_010945, partial [Myodes glareolus]